MSVPVQEPPPQLPFCTVLSNEMIDAPELRPWAKELTIPNNTWRKAFEYTHLLWTLDQVSYMHL